jgi:hypothetical protein
MHEIVTLQFGQQSNYLGTHFWNTQVGCSLQLLLSFLLVLQNVIIFLSEALRCALSYHPFCPGCVVVLVSLQSLFNTFEGILLYIPSRRRVSC